MPRHKKKFTVLIADDHPGWIAGVRSIIQKAPDMRVVGEVQDGDQIKTKVARLKPDVLLLDLVMPNHNPTEFERWVRDNCPDTITLVLTAHDRDAYLAGMMEAGASGYLDKKIKANDLLAAIRRAARGEVIYDQEQMDRARRWREDISTKWESLSDREREVLQMLSEGASNKDISAGLKIAVHTVEKHLKNLYEKLGVTSRTEAVCWWVEKGTDFRD